MCKRLPQVVFITVHLCAHCHRRVWRQEAGFYVDLLIYEGTNRGRCDGGGWAVAARPPQPTYSTKKKKSHTRTFTLHQVKSKANLRDLKAWESSGTQGAQVKGEGWNSHYYTQKMLYLNLFIRIYLTSLKHWERHKQRLIMLKVRQASFLNVVYFPALLGITNTKKGRFSYQQLDVNMSGSGAASHMAPSLVLLAAVALTKHSLCNRHKGSSNC